MIWESDSARLALLELLSRGSLKRRRTQLEAYDALAELPWTRATGRRDEIGVVEERRTELASLIGRVWPAWRDVLADLAAAGLSPTPDGYGRLLDMERAAAIPELPKRINRRTAASLTASHSKALLTEARRGALGGTDTSHDGAIRLRPPAGLAARTANGAVNLMHLRRRAPNLKWFLPEFWFELVDLCGLPTTWPQDLDLDFAPAPVRALAARGLWLEQERIVFDPRMADALKAALAGEAPGEPSQ